MSNYNESLAEVHGSINTSGKVGWRRILSFLGPAYMVSVGYMDPGNWATDLAAGSKFGYQLIWVLLLSNLIALLLQSLSTRLGIVQGLDFGTDSHYCLRFSRSNWYGHRFTIAVSFTADLGRFGYTFRHHFTFIFAEQRHAPFRRFYYFNGFYCRPFLFDRDVYC